MNPKKLRQLKKATKKARTTAPTPYIAQLTRYRDLFDKVPQVKYLLNAALLDDQLLKSGLLPQPLPKLLLPNDIQTVIFNQLAAKYPQGDATGDRLWDQYTAALPKVDALLRDYRDYLEETYGMWSFTNVSFISSLSDYLKGAPVLEVMAGNGYLSKGLKDKRPTQTVFTTDSTAWVKENQTGRHPVISIEPLDALAAVDKYADQVEYVIMSWAPDKGEADWDLLEHLREHYPALKLLVIGEKDGATNSKRFWQEAQLSQDGLAQVNAALKSFDLIDEQVYLAK